ncbi:hypothetical protein FRC08_006889 [Ceratobasidium sp. 394]|nr:hypothetical protein FRC08_006889 [Ceratobasidium sp. 394]
MSIAPTASCTTPHHQVQESDCSFCQSIITDWIICHLCGFRYCRNCAKADSPQALWASCCPSCVNRHRKVCPDISFQPGAPVPVAVLFLYVEEYKATTWHLMNTVVGTLKCEGVQVSPYLLTTQQATVNTEEYFEWLSDQPVQSTFLAFFVTETVLNGGWVWTNKEAERGWESEVTLLNSLFNSEPEWQSLYSGFRDTYLVVLSCGGNFSPARGEPNLAARLTDWLTSVDAFGNLIAFMNPRMIISEVHGFCGLLVRELCVSHTPIQEALVQSYCRDDHVRAHTDIVWCTARHPPLVLRNASGARVCGIDLPPLCLSTCRAAHRRVKRGGGDIHALQPVALTTQCCKAKYLLRASATANVPEERQEAGFQYILEQWPATFAYSLEKRV